MLAATFALSSCDDSVAIEQTPSKGVPFEVSTLLTKTTNDGLATNWAASDAINLFHAEAGSTSYTSDGKFTVDEALTGKFSGTLAKALEDGASYDWYAFYPYSSYITTPANTSGYPYIGGRSDTPQTQTGNDSKAHLSGTACPLYGVANDVASDAKPAIAMKHAASVVAIKVTNTLADALTVSSISFTSTENIVGQFYIDFSSDTAKYKDGPYVSSTANLTVTGGEAIAQNASAVFYIAIKPHTAASGSTLKISVNGAEKTLTLPKDVTFTAGSIKTLAYGYDSEEADYVTLPWSIDGTGGSSVWKSTPGLSQNGLGSDYAAVNSPYLAKFDTAGDYVQVKYDSPAKSIAFKVKKLGGKKESTITVVGSSDNITYNTIEAFTVSGSQNEEKSFEMTAAINSEYRYVRIEFTNKGANVGLGGVSIKKDSTDPVIEADNILDVSARGVEAEALSYSITNPVTGTAISATCDGTVVTEVVADSEIVLYTVSKNTTGAAREGRITLTYGSVTKDVKVSQLADTFKTSVEELILDADADATKTLTVTSDFDWIAESSDDTKFTVSLDTYISTGDGKQTVTVTAVSANASEEGTITLGTITFSNIETEVTKVVTVKQKSSYVAPVTGTTVTFDYPTLYSTITDTNSKDLDGLTDTVDVVSITYQKKSGSNTPKYYAKGTNLRIYATSTLTITVPEGKIITSVDFSQGTTKWASQKMTADSGSVKDDDRKWTYDSTNPSNTLVLTVSDTFNFTKIVVTYE